MSDRAEIMTAVDARGEFGRGVFHGVCRYAVQDASWRLLLDDDEGRATYWRDCHLDGLVSGIADPDLLARAASHSRWVVNASASVDPTLYPSVINDNEAIAQAAAAHLLDRGFVHLAFYGGERSIYSRQRRDFFARAVEAAGKSCLIYDWPRDPDGGIDYVRADTDRGDWLISSPKPLGLFTAYDGEAFSILRVCQDIGLSVPEEVAVLGVDNDQLRDPVASPPLSSVQPDFEGIGYRAAALLDDLMAGKAPPAEPIRVKPLGVVTRRSTDIVAVEDPELAQALRMIREHACDPISVDNVLDAIMVSRRTLERRFKETLGRTPHQEILRHRLARAEELLLRSEMKTAQIARECGFSHVQNFNACFRKAYRQTPGQFRNARRVG